MKHLGSPRLVHDLPVPSTLTVSYLFADKQEIGHESRFPCPVISCFVCLDEFPLCLFATAYLKFSVQDTCVRIILVQSQAELLSSNERDVLLSRQYERSYVGKATIVTTTPDYEPFLYGTLFSRHYLWDAGPVQIWYFPGMAVTYSLCTHSEGQSHVQPRKGD